MSAFAVTYDRSGSPVDPGMLERVMGRLSHRGPDGSDTFMAGNVALGHWHFWTTPEEAGEKQPVVLDGLPFRIVFDGRLDNRADLLDRLQAGLPQGISDAALVLHAYAHWGEHCFEFFIGEYALAVYDEQRGELLCARDPLGDRTLFYTWQGTCLMVASEPRVIAGLDGGTPCLNENAVAHFFALRAPGDGQTLFKGVYELPPAHAMRINTSGQHFWRFWEPEPLKKLRYKEDAEYAEHFLALLEDSVRCRMRANTPVGVLMSGGLDSTSVACLAARMMAPRQLTTFSYVFDELKDCDEREYIDAVKEKWNTRTVQIPCDDAWPLKDWKDWPHNPNHPEGNPYRLLKERAYRQVRQNGFRVLLTGGFGDHLYTGWQDWIADLLGDGRYLDAGREVVGRVRTKGLRASLADGYLWRIARRVLGKLWDGMHIHYEHVRSPWLTPSAIRAVSDTEGSAQTSSERQASLLGLWAAQSSSIETFNASRYGFELRHPYRDRRLIEYMLAIPAYQFFYRGVYKYVLRMAMQGILPETVRTRGLPTYLRSLFLRGMEREVGVLNTCRDDTTASWRNFVRPNWLGVILTPDKAGREGLVPWLCVSYESWYNKLTGENCLL